MEIPQPPISGAEGTQELDSAPLPSVEPYAPLSGLQLAQRMEGLAATRPRNLGGEVAASLIAGTFSHLSEQLREQQDAARTANATATRLQEQLSQARERAAVLDERVRSFERTQTVRQVAIFAGTALCAIAIDLYKASLTVVAVIAGALGVALLAFGWRSGAGGSNEK